MGAGALWIMVGLDVPFTLAVLTAMAAMLLATGAFHEDGLGATQQVSECVGLLILITLL